jgi:signal transduction histidine kinase/DNA-binding NarL/FixJ family response regulator
LQLYLTPVAIGYLTQLVLVTLISGYLLLLLRRSRHVPHIAWLARFFIAFGGFIATLFLEAVLPPTFRLYAVYVQNTCLGMALICLLRFAYKFPKLLPARRREARLALLVSVIYTLWEGGFAAFRFFQLCAGVIEYRPNWSDYALLLLFLWIPTAFLRQIGALRDGDDDSGLWARYVVPLLHPTSRAVRTLRTFALIFLLVAGLNLFNILRAVYLLTVALANLGISLGILIALFAFVLAYLNYRAETTSFMVKLAGVTLTAMLAIMGVVGWVISPAYIAHHEPGLNPKRALRFTPNARGGYDVVEIPYAFESDLGHDLQLDDGLRRGCSEALDFAFPFYGQDYWQVYVCNDGAVSLGRALPYRAFQYRYGAGTPLLLPLLMDLDPTISPGGVFVRQEAGRLILTWNRLRGFRQPEAEFTFQAILYADGAFDFAYADLPESLAFRPNDDPGASLWAVGALPGHLTGPGPQTTVLSGSNLPLQSGPEGVVQDHHLEFRQYLHALLAPLAGLILAASLFILVGFPIMFYVSLASPLNALLRGVRLIEAGDYTGGVPVQFHDEIGFLTAAFNTLAAQLGDLIHNLEARVAARTEELDRANAQLRAEIVEREQAQATVVEQQRTLAAFEERERLGRELHDGLGQVLGYINVQAQAAERLLDQGQAEAVQASLHQLAQAAREAHADVRGHILGLRAADGGAEAAKMRQDLGAVLGAYAQQFQARYGVATQLWLPEDLPTPLFAPGVEEQALRIVQEAMTNAGRHAQADKVEVIFSLVGDLVQIMVTDDGVGFDASRHVGTSAPHTPGSALHFGLEIMRERAERVGGMLETRSAPGQGTRISATLPRFLPTAEEIDDDGTLRDLRLLLADDHPLFLDGLRNLLVARGLTVAGTARDGREVLEKTRILHPDVVVMDLNMPHGGGLEATRAIKAEFPEIKIVVLTVSEDETSLFEAIKSGASGYLLKSLEANQFCRLLIGLMCGDAPLAPGLGERILAEFARSAAPGKPVVEEALTPRQLEVLGLVAQGLTYKEVGETLSLSEKTIKYHMGNILEILNVENRTQAIAYLQQHHE